VRARRHAGPQVWAARRRKAWRGGAVTCDARNVVETRKLIEALASLAA